MRGVLAIALTYEQWHYITWLVAVPLFGLSGWGLLYVGARFLAKSPKATVLRSLTCYVASSAVGGLVAAVGLTVSFDTYVVEAHILGTLVSVTAALALCWAIVARFLAVSYWRGALAWLPELLLVPILLGGLALDRAIPLVPSPPGACLGNLYRLRQPLMMYRFTNRGKFPPGLQALVFSGVPLGELRCPVLRERCPGFARRFDYFYFPRDPNADRDRMIACDYAGNHRDGTRHVLFADGGVSSLKEVQFEKLLARPVNAEFADALRAAEENMRGPPDRR